MEAPDPDANGHHILCVHDDRVGAAIDQLAADHHTHMLYGVEVPVGIGA